MNDAEFKKYKIYLKTISDSRFKKVIDKQRDHTDPKFIGMLERSPYFKEFFFEAFIEGMDFGRKIDPQENKDN